MDRACRGVLAEVQGLPHAHELQACCCVQVAQQAVVSLVWDRGLAVATGSSAPQHCFLQGMLLCLGLSGYVEYAARTADHLFIKTWSESDATLEDENVQSVQHTWALPECEQQHYYY